MAFAIYRHKSATGVHVSASLNPPFCNELITGQARDRLALTMRLPSVSEPILHRRPHARRLYRDSSARAQTWTRPELSGPRLFLVAEGIRHRFSPCGAWELLALHCQLLCTQHPHQKCLPGRSRLMRTSVLLVLPTPSSLLLCVFLSSSPQRNHCSLHHENLHVKHLLKLTLRLFQDSLAWNERTLWFLC